MPHAIDHSPPFALLKRDGRRTAAVGLVGALTLGTVLIPLFGLGWAHPAAAAALFAAFMAAAARWLPEHLPHSALGAANRVTVLRAALVANLGALALAPEALAAHGWGAAALALGALALDGVDGWTARRFGLASPFGARFDQELDALTILILAALAWRLGDAGVWVLLAGLLRYLFVAAQAALPRLRGVLPPSQRRRWICVFAVSALIAILTPAVGPPLSTGLAAATVALLSISFARDITWLLKRRPGETAARHGTRGGFA